MIRFVEVLKTNKLVRLFIRPIYNFIIIRLNKLFFIRNSKNVLLYFNSIMIKEGKLFWLDYGTLLGAIREKKFIKNDIDIDIGMFFCDYNYNLECILLNAGFHKVREFTSLDDQNILEITYYFKGVLIDIFLYHKGNNNDVYCYGFRPHDESILGLHPTKHKYVIRRVTFSLEGLVRYKFLDSIFYIPKNYNIYLSQYYGKDFLTPNMNWNAKRDVQNVVELKERIGCCTLYIK